MANNNIPSEYLGLALSNYKELGNDLPDLYFVEDSGNGPELKGPEPHPDLEPYYLNALSNIKQEQSRIETRKRLGELTHPLTGLAISTANPYNAPAIERDLTLAQHDVTRALALGVVNKIETLALYNLVNEILSKNEIIKAAVRNDPLNTDVQSLWDE